MSWTIEFGRETPKDGWSIMSREVEAVRKQANISTLVLLKAKSSGDYVTIPLPLPLPYIQFSQRSLENRPPNN